MMNNAENTNRAYCTTCNGIRSITNNKCKQCDNMIMNSRTSESKQIEGQKSSSPSIHESHSNYEELEGRITRKLRMSPPPQPTQPTQPPPPPPPPPQHLIIADYDESSSDEYDDDKDRFQLSKGDNKMGQDEDIDIISDHTLYPSSSILHGNDYKERHKEERKIHRHRHRHQRHRNHKHNKYENDYHSNNEKRQKKRSKYANHYKNNHKNKKIKKEVIDLISDKEHKSYINKVNQQNKANPIYVSDSDNENNINDNRNYMDLNEEKSQIPDSLQYANDNNNVQRIIDSINNEYEWNKLPLNAATKRGIQSLPPEQLPLATTLVKDIIHHVKYGTNHLVNQIMDRQQGIVALVASCIDAAGLQEINSVNNGSQMDSYFDDSKRPCILCIAPRREQALQLRRLFMEISRFYCCYASVLIGGISTYQCVRRLSHGMDVVTGTPGKLSHLIQKDILNKSYFKNLIMVALDQYNDLQSNSMTKQMDIIKRCCPKSVRVVMLETIIPPHQKANHATFIRSMDNRIQNISHERQRINYVGSTKEENEKQIQSMQHVEKFIYNDSEKNEILYEILQRYAKGKSVVVFFNKRDRVDKRFEEYLSNNIRNEDLLCLHSKFTNPQRSRIRNTFKNNKSAILFCTDILLLSGLIVDIIINYDIPLQSAVVTYAKRALLTKKVIFNFVSSEDQENMDLIKQYYFMDTIRYRNYTRNRRHN